MTELTPLREMPSNTLFQEGDVFVLFGELFGRGYATGLVEMARNTGMTILGITVGRRDKEQNLRPLNEEELSEAEERLGGKIINLPLEAGFDMDAPEGMTCPADMLKAAKKDNWESFSLDWDAVKACQETGVNRFKATLNQVVDELKGMIPEGKNVFFAHTMAGGIPRAKILMLVANHVFKGRGKKYLSSAAYWGSDIGKLCAINFSEVTANTLKHLIDATADLRQQVETSGGQVRYSAYGYHGTEILIHDTYQWQTYTPYKQGDAKKELEQHAEEAWKNGIKATVYNCPEIRTNSSDIFAGVELSLFPLLRAFKKEASPEWAEKHWKDCQDLLKDDQNLEEILEKLDSYFDEPVIQSFQKFDQWPMDNTPELSEVMVGTSEDMVAIHKDRKSLITDYLSSLVLDGTGPLIFNETSNPAGPVLWLGHDIITKQLIK
jgi:hypothetical protein